jgi:hypothetical protein
MGPVKTSEYYAGHQLVCALINTFSAEVEFTVDHAVEMPPRDSIVLGIRPMLFFLLKQVYVGKGGLRICANDRCGRIFISERQGQRYHDSLCSRKYRQRVYVQQKRNKGRNHPVPRKADHSRRSLHLGDGYRNGMV